ncbi:MAG: response regulator transcription factor, partial [Deltaproteobacteria bacterium]|nr:response regulator transcription factor [Deltaproteobacteria bacterium]
MVTNALMVEDDRKLSALLVEFLGQHAVEATVAADAGAALKALETKPFDIILLDLMLPGMDGLTLAKRIREKWQTPIIMVTARGDDADKIVGLELGADDYLAKPFNPRELLARMRAVLRRAGEAEAGAQRLARFVTGGLIIDFDAREVTVEG